MIHPEWLCAERGPVVPDVAIWNRGSDQDIGVLTYCEDLTRRPKAEWAAAARPRQLSQTDSVQIG